MKKLFHFFNSDKSFKNLVTYGIGQGFNLITPLLVIPYIVSICNEDGYGKIGVGMALSFFLIVFIDYGSDIIGVKDVAVSRDNYDKLEKIFITTFSAKFILMLMVCAASSLIFYFVPYFSSEKGLFFLGLSILAGQSINPTWFFQGTENFQWITIVNVVGKGIYVLGVFLFIKQSGDYIYNNLFWGIGMIVANGAAFLYIIWKYSFSFRKTKKSEVIYLMKSNFSMFSSQIFVSLQMYSPIMLIGFFGGNAMAGHYKIVDQVIVVFKTYILLFFNFAFPKVCYLLETNRQQAMAFWKTCNGLNGLFVWGCMAVIFVFSTEVVSYFNPKDIEEISNLLRIAVCIPVLQSINIPLKQLVLGLGKQREYIQLMMVMTIMSLIAIVLITPFYDVKGVLFILIFAELAILLLYIRALKIIHLFGQVEKQSYF